MGEKVIAVDVGGTTIKLGLVDRAGSIIRRLELTTPVKVGEDAIIQQIAAGTETILQEQKLRDDDVMGIGIGVPGFLDKQQGIVTMAPNIGWYNYPAKSKLQALTNLPVELDNDANCAVIGERWLGAGQMVDNLIMMTIGTGIGGGIIINGEVVHGAQGIGGEIGHITVDPHGIPCGCGKVGCLETIASAGAICRMALQYLVQGEHSSLRSTWETTQEITPRQVVEAAQNGDPLAHAVFDQVAYSLALVLSGLTHALNPEKILVGGGISYTGEALFKPLQTYFTRFTLVEANHQNLIAQAQLGNDAGLIGAAYNILKL